MEYPYTTTNVQPVRRGNYGSDTTFKEIMHLPTKAQWRAVSDKEVSNLKRINVCTFLLMAAVPTEHKIVGSRWVYKVKANNL